MRLGRVGTVVQDLVVHFSPNRAEWEEMDGTQGTNAALDNIKTLEKESGDIGQ